MRPCLGNPRGTTLVMTMMAIVVVSILALGIFSVTRAMLRESVYQMRLAQAQTIAEAGLEDALLQLRLNTSWRTGFTNKPFGIGAYTVTLSTDASPWITSKGVSTSIAFIGSPHATVRAQTQLTGGTTTSACTTFSQSGTTVNGLANAYDSAVSTNPAVFSEGGRYCSNNSFSTKSSTSIIVNMDVDYFSGSAPAAATIGGSITHSTFTQTIAAHSGAAFASANDNVKLPVSYYSSGSKSLTIPTNIAVTVTSGTYWLNSLNVNGNLRVDGSAGSVIFYVNSSFNLQNLSGAGNGEITNLTAIPSRLILYPQGGSGATFSSKAATFAVVDAVASNVTLNSPQIFYGNITGNNVSINNGATFHFDQETAAASSTTTHATWQPGSWSSSP